MRLIEELIEIELIDGYLSVKYLVDELSLDEAINIVNHRIKITNNEPCYILADLSNIKKSSKEVRNYFANEGAKNILGSAFYFNRLLPSLLFNFFIFLSHPKVEIKAFDNKDSAETWLISIINKDSISQQ